MQIIKSMIMIFTVMPLLISMANIEESKVTYKHYIQEKQVLNESMPFSIKENNSNADKLNNKTLPPEKAIANGDIVAIYYPYGISSKTNNDIEIYNINKLDEFMKNVDNHKRDEIRIVEYEYDGKITRVNKLFDLNYNGKNVEYIVYDTYSDKNAFIPSEPFKCVKVIRRDYPNDFWYGLCCKNDKKDDCSTLISLNKSSIIK